ncbi:hypothetical protein EMCRGX_G024257 [Ephydatia muelleri]
MPFFAKSQLTLQTWVMLLHFWSCQNPVSDTAECAKVALNTAVDVYQWLREVVEQRLTWLKQKLAQLGLNRRNQTETPLPLLQGYRAMWRLLQVKHGYTVKRSTVMMLLAVMDPEGTRQRKKHRLIRRTYVNKGPNWCWHIDGYDKLKPFGFPIHACIDGYSRKILWLEVSTTNNDPAVVIKYYLDTVLKLGGYLTLLRSDYGTENTSIATCQMMFQHPHRDRYAGPNSFVFGSSIRNTIKKILKLNGGYNFLRTWMRRACLTLQILCIAI